jgi:nitrile hydratase beta subunit
MNGIHDLGGMHGLGPINPEPNEPVFHEDWERHMFGLMIAVFAGGLYNVDEFRHGIERMDPAHYLTSSYYEHWLESVERLAIEKGWITREEIDARKAKLAGELQ